MDKSERYQQEAYSRIDLVPKSYREYLKKLYADRVNFSPERIAPRSRLFRADGSLLQLSPHQGEVLDALVSYGVEAQDLVPDSFWAQTSALRRQDWNRSTDVQFNLYEELADTGFMLAKLAIGDSSSVEKLVSARKRKDRNLQVSLIQERFQKAEAWLEPLIIEDHYEGFARLLVKAMDNRQLRHSKPIVHPRLLVWERLLQSGKEGKMGELQELLLSAYLMYIENPENEAEATNFIDNIHTVIQYGHSHVGLPEYADTLADDEFYSRMIPFSQALRGAFGQMDINWEAVRQITLAKVGLRQEIGVLASDLLKDLPEINKSDVVQVVTQFCMPYVLAKILLRGETFVAFA